MPFQEFPIKFRWYKKYTYHIIKRTFLDHIDPILVHRLCCSTSCFYVFSRVGKQTHNKSLFYYLQITFRTSSPDQCVVCIVCGFSPLIISMIWSVIYSGCLQNVFCPDLHPRNLHPLPDLCDFFYFLPLVLPLILYSHLFEDLLLPLDEKASSADSPHLPF